jgi:hypothetical protein
VTHSASKSSPTPETLRAREKNGRTMPSFPPDVQALLDLVAEVILNRLIEAESADVAPRARRSRS